MDLLLRAAAVILAGLLPSTLLAQPVPRPRPHLPPPACPALVAEATRLLLVTTPDMRSKDATARLYERTGPESAWSAEDAPFAVTVGRNGLGWAWDQTPPGASPVKREGDGKAPAGIFAAGIPFGFGARALAGYVDLEADSTICVDDVRSARYSEIIQLADLDGAYSHEKMWETTLYRKGVVVNHASNPAARGGSCIFLHVWRAPGRPTAGCVAMPEERVERLQTVFDGAAAAIAILPEPALGQLESCGLPGVT